MTALPETQMLMLEVLLGRNDNTVAGRLLRHAPGLPPTRRLQIYRNNLFESLTAALEAVFPVVAQLVGEHFFRQLARGFIAAHPSRAGSLHGFGRELPAYIAQQDSLLVLPYLGDVASLEWACHEVYHEADHEALAPARLAGIPAARQQKVCLHLAPATRFVASRFPVLRIWQSHQDSTQSEVPISLDDGGVRLLVARRGGDIEFRVLSEPEDDWLRSLAAGATLAAATAAAFASDAAFDLGGVLSRHLSLGSFADVSQEGSP